MVPEPLTTAASLMVFTAAASSSASEPLFRFPILKSMEKRLVKINDIPESNGTLTKVSGVRRFREEDEEADSEEGKRLKNVVALIPSSYFLR